MSSLRMRPDSAAELAKLIVIMLLTVVSHRVGHNVGQLLKTRLGLSMAIPIPVANSASGDCGESFGI